MTPDAKRPAVITSPVASEIHDVAVTTNRTPGLSLPTALEERIATLEAQVAQLANGCPYACSAACSSVCKLAVLR